jgi:hypothetical protein
MPLPVQTKSNRLSEGGASGLSWPSGAKRRTRRRCATPINQWMAKQTRAAMNKRVIVLKVSPFNDEEFNG